jgi:hypothetical protein
MGRFACEYSKSDIPAGCSGDWVLERFSIPAPPVLDPPIIDTRPEWAQTPPGEYTVLRRHGELFMTDTPDEWWTQLEAFHEVQRRGGQVLVTGLGLGLFPEMILTDPTCQVTKITVIEKSADVIALVAGHLQARYGTRLEVIHADALEWLPPADAHYTVGWHDIWPNARDPICAEQIQALQTRYQRFCDWQGAWTLPD